MGGWVAAQQKGVSIVVLRKSNSKKLFVSTKEPRMCFSHTPSTPDRFLEGKEESSTSSSSHLDLDGVVKSLLLLDLLGDSLGAHDTTTPVALGLLSLGEVAVLDSGDELGELRAVLGADLGESEDGSGLAKISTISRGKFDSNMLTFLWTTVPRRALPFTMA